MKRSASQTRLWLGWVASATVGCAIAAGCIDVFDDGTLFQQSAPKPGGAGSTGGNGGNGGNGGATVQPECIPGVSSAPVDDRCGVFVSANGSNTNPGTKTAPKKTLVAALDAAMGAPVYVCTDGVEGAVTLHADATIYGGLDCANGWQYVGLDTKTPWTAGADEIPLRIAAGARAVVTDVAIRAANATVSGGSSIGALAEVGTQLTLRRCDVSAGKGADGAAGDTPIGMVAAGIDGSNGTGSCASDETNVGGNGGDLTCGTTSVKGGDGGNGTKSTAGSDGSDGRPYAMEGQAGKGQDDMISCATGGNGKDGASGDPGNGASGSLGMLGPEGYIGPSGADGKPGQPGQGGGGGGGGKGCMNGNAGPSGGGGGSGGCGGAGGKGGKAGGSSIAILSLGSKLALDTVRLSAESGGNGGDGGAGQEGGMGGKGGQPGPAEDVANRNLATACAGGNGGMGGMGGMGGGGRGGHSFGIAYVGDTPDASGATIRIGTGGKGGGGEGDKGDGQTGIAAEMQAF